MSLLVLLGPIVTQRGLLLHAHDETEEHGHLLPLSLGAADHHGDLHDWHEHEHGVAASSEPREHGDQGTSMPSGVVVRLADTVPHAQPATPAACVLAPGTTAVMPQCLAHDTWRTERPPGVRATHHVVERGKLSAVAALLSTSHAILI